MNDILQTFSVWFAAIFWGGLLVTYGSELYLHYTLTEKQRETANPVLEIINRMFGLAQIALAGLVFLTALLGGAGVAVVLPTVFLILLAAANAAIFELYHRMDAPNLADDTSAENERAIKQLELAHIATNIFEIVLGAIVIAALIFA